MSVKISRSRQGKVCFFLSNQKHGTLRARARSREGRDTDDVRQTNGIAGGKNHPIKIIDNITVTARHANSTTFYSRHLYDI